MKAYKPINLSFEKRIVFSSAVLLSFICSFIVLSPVIAQESDKDEPDVRIDVEKEYDEQGNIIGYDSTYTWSWHGKDFDEFHDSIFSHFKHCWPSQNWQWHEMDSSLHSYFNNDWFDRFHFHDSLGISFHDFDDMHLFFEEEFDIGEYLPDEKFFEEFNQKHSEFMESFDEYQKEHQKLIEKYFRQPYHKGDSEPESEPNKYSPDQSKPDNSKSGKV